MMRPGSSRTAGLHQHTHSTHGYHESNFIGATPQPNDPQENWPGFFSASASSRCSISSMPGSCPRQKNFLRVCLSSPSDVQPSLLHGDLWGGNKSFLSDGTPVLFDPACYYGHACADLAMTTPGGFGIASTTAIASMRRHHSTILMYDLYNIYHLLNHAVLSVVATAVRQRLSSLAIYDRFRLSL